MLPPTPNLRPEQESDREAPNAPRAQRTILTHAVAGGLTPLVPLPFVDEMLLTRVQVRMVQEIAHAHHKNLPADACKALGTESSPRGDALVLVAKKLAFLPIKRLFRKALVLWTANDIIDLTSRTYHVGLLVDFAIAQPWFDTRAPHEVRAAIDRVCDTAHTSPVRRVVSSVFKESGDLLDDAAQAVRARFAGRGRGAATAGFADAPPPLSVSKVVDRLQRALVVLPASHFEALRTALADELRVHASS